jgi:hypothetical protein
MIIDNGKYYLYRYIRNDKDEPFYIGIGTKTNKKIGFRSIKSEYHRAYKKHTGKIYNDISDKTGYNVEILIESDDYEFIKQKEIEFIKLYGRIDKKSGSLSNLTDGGDGNYGYVFSKETKNKISKNNYIKGKFGKNHPNSKRVYQYDKQGNFVKEWDSVKSIGIVFNPTTHKTPSFKNNRFKEFLWFYEFKGNTINI